MKPSYSKGHHSSARRKYWSEIDFRLLDKRQSPPKSISVNEIQLIIGGLLGLQLIAALFIVTILYPFKVANAEVASFDAPPPVTFQPLPQQQPAPAAPSTQPDQIGATLPSTDPPVDEISSVQAPAVSVRIRGVEVTQGIQVFNEPENAQCQPDPNRVQYIFCNNSVPLVAGRHTLVRVYLACAATCPTEAVQVTLRMFKNEVEQESLTQQFSAALVGQLNAAPLETLRSNLDNSLNFAFLPPPLWMSGPIAFAVEATVGTETATLTTTHNFAPRKPLRIAYLPIQYQGFTPPDALNSDYWLRRLYPVPAVEYYRLPVPDLVWEGELNKGELLQELLYTYWLYTQHNPVESWPDQLFGWLSPEVYNGGASDPAWCTDCAGSHSGRVAFGSLRSERDIGGPRILAHEIAHNLGAKHAWSPTQQQDGQCFRAEGADIQVDPTWPYAETPYIQEIGLDLYSDPPLVYPAATYDMMAYCAQPWISPYTYRTLFESQLLQPISGDSNASADFRPNQPPKNTLLISGLIYPNGTASQPQVVQLETAQPANPIPQSGPTTEDYSGDYCLTLSAYDNATLAKYCFAATFVDTETGLLTEASPYFFTLPNLEVSQIARITLNSGTTSLATLTPSSTPPDVTLTFPNAGETLSDQQTITWQARDTDGDQLTYDLLYSPDAGQTWLPLAVHLTERHYTFETAALLFSQQALIRVIANDGFHTQIDETDKTFTIDNLPH